MILIGSEFLLLLVVISLGGMILFFLLRLLEKGLRLNRKRAVYFSTKLIVCYYLFALFFTIPICIWNSFPKSYSIHSVNGDFKTVYLLKQPIQYRVILEAHPNWMIGILALWIIGFGWNYFFYIYRKRSILHKLIQIRKIQVKPEIHRMKEQIAREMKVEKEILIFDCDVISSPFVTGRRTIEIYLPKRDFSEEEIEFILKHELVHVKNRDIIFQEIVLYLRCFFWFNPLFRVFQEYFFDICELMCDEIVLEKENKKRQFSYLDIIRSFLNDTSDFQNLVGFSSFHLVEQRILHVRQLQKKKKRMAGIFLIGLLTIHILGMTFFAAHGVLIIQAKLGDWLGAKRFTKMGQGTEIGFFREYAIEGIDFAEIEY